MSRAVCIITARGGSKRIPRKNIRDFCGKPIIVYSIEAALKSGLFDEVMVSTDDDEIAAIAAEYGASVPFMRSEENSGDCSATADVVREVLAEYEKRGLAFDIVCCLYPTAPFVSPDELREAMEVIGEGATSVIPVSAYDFAPLRGFILNKDGLVSHAFPEYAKTRSQDLPVMVHDCGRFYVAKTNAFEESGSFMTAVTKSIVIPAKLVQDIDTPEDWELAELKYRVLNRED